MKNLTNMTNVQTMLLLLILCGSSLFFSCKDKPQNAAIPTYRTMQIGLTNATISSNYSASIRGKQNVEIRPQVSGLITQICINEGATVTKGQTLFIIDQVTYMTALETATANVKSAEARVATAQLTYNSKQELYNANVISEFELQTAQNSLLEAQASLKQAKAQEANASNNLSYTVIKSPVDGVAGMIAYRVGALVSSSISEPLVTVSSEDEMYAYFSMTENQVLSLAEENSSLSEMIENMPPVKLILGNNTPYDISGKIDAISGTIDPKTGAISIRASFDNPKNLLRNGGSATIIIPYEKKNCI
ncbi:efflux RND transporter periplasmic adaptor subunit, partial [Parabacteroides sp. OttesenSCG-928-G21]|nr:efflux RND transporter periplasmic adaptor subunit [Parabacteroides sp. OttesenSCG-928-G21]